MNLSFGGHGRDFIQLLTPEGRLGYVQKVAGAPGAVDPNGTHEYAVGAFMLAGTEIAKLQNDKKFDFWRDSGRKRLYACGSGHPVYSG